MSAEIGYEKFEDLIADLVDDETYQCALSSGDVLAGNDLAKNRPEIHTHENEDGRAWGVAINRDYCDPPLLLFEGFRKGRKHDGGLFFPEGSYTLTVDTSETAKMFIKALNSVDWD